jgi:hypothetical protein
MESNWEPHIFLFAPGIWLGEGKVTFNASPEEVLFYTRWEIHEKENRGIFCKQFVEMQGIEERMENSFWITNIAEFSFSIELKNEMIEDAKGKGIIEKNKIGWEFRGGSTFEGFEVYERKSKEEYELHAEYASHDLFRTIINGKIWKKSQT